MLLIAALSCSPGDPPDLSELDSKSFKELYCSIQRYRLTLDGFRRDGVKTSRKFGKDWGNIFHRHRVSVWESLADKGIVSRPANSRTVRYKGKNVTEYETFLGTYGKHVYQIGDRYEIWIEKNLTDPDTGKPLFRADGVVIEFDEKRRPKRILVSNPTSRSVDDPRWRQIVNHTRRGSPAASAAGMHAARNKERAEELKRQILRRRPDLSDLNLDEIVVPDTPEGAFYRTAADKAMRKNLRKPPDIDRGSAPGATKALIAGILINQAVSSLLADQGMAAQGMESDQARAKLNLMIRA